MVMCDFADFLHSLFENPVCGGVCNHTARKVVLVLLGLGAEVLKINIAILRRLDHNNFPPHHLGARRVCPMCTHRNEANIAVTLTLRLVILRNREKTRIFALRARVRLHRHPVIARDVAKLGAQVFKHFGIAKRLVLWRKRMHHRKFAPAHRHHFCRRVEFHGARAQRDHRAIQRQITVRQAAHVAHHLGLGAVHVKDRVLQI